MTSTQRFCRLKDKTGLTLEQLAEIFGVNIKTVRGWYEHKNQLQPDLLRTLLRLEADNLAKLAPGLSQSTVRAFYHGRLA